MKYAKVIDYRVLIIVSLILPVCAPQPIYIGLHKEVDDTTLPDIQQQILETSNDLYKAIIEDQLSGRLQSGKKIVLDSRILQWWNPDIDIHDQQRIFIHSHSDDLINALIGDEIIIGSVGPNIREGIPLESLRCIGDINTMAISFSQPRLTNEAKLQVFMIYHTYVTPFPNYTVGEFAEILYTFSFKEEKWVITNKRFISSS